jgi:D-alanyl-D-alanine dipeptidase
MGILWLCAIFFAASANSFALPQGFVYLEDIEPTILVDLRYSGKNNFIGRPIDGYLQPRCIMTKETAEALKRIQSELHSFGLGLSDRQEITVSVESGLGRIV